MCPRSDDHWIASSESLGNAIDIVEAIREIHVRENAIRRQGGKQTLADGVTFSTVRLITDNPNVRVAGPPIPQPHRGVVGAAVADKYNFPACKLPVNKGIDLFQRVFEK